MNDFEQMPEDLFHSVDYRHQTNVLREPILTEINQALRTRRRDRLITRFVLAGLLIGVAGNFATNRYEQARMARWFPNATVAPLTFTTNETVLVQTEQPTEPTVGVWEDYLVSYRPSYPSVSQRKATRAMAAWIDELTQTGRGS